MNEITERIIDDIAEVAVENLMRDGFLQPVGFMLGDSGIGVASLLVFRTPELKRASMEMLGKIAEKGEWDVAVVVSDAHMSTRPISNPDGPPPSLDPVAVEIILVSAKHRDGTTVSVIVPYTRGEDGKVTSFGEKRKMTGGHIGLMDPVFPQAQVMH